MKANEYKAYKGLRKESLRDNMTDIEIALTNIGEIAARDIAKEEKPKGLKENMKVASRGGRVAKGARDLYEEETKKSIPKGAAFSNESLFWTGYIYRYWHFLTGQSSNEINSICDAKMMNTLYPGYHALDCTMAVERILEGKD